MTMQFSRGSCGNYLWKILVKLRFLRSLLRKRVFVFHGKSAVLAFFLSLHCFICMPTWTLQSGGDCGKIAHFSFVVGSYLSLVRALFLHLLLRRVQVHLSHRPQERILFSFLLTHDFELWFLGFRAILYDTGCINLCAMMFSRMKRLISGPHLIPDVAPPFLIGVL